MRQSVKHKQAAGNSQSTTTPASSVLGKRSTYLLGGKVPQELKNKIKKDLLNMETLQLYSSQLVYQLMLEKYQDS